MSVVSERRIQSHNLIGTDVQFLQVHQLPDGSREGGQVIAPCESDMDKNKTHADSTP